jgi:hypothetical protein
MDIQFRIACTDPGEKIRLKINGEILGTVTLPNTSGWQNWETVTIEDVIIPAGENQILRLEFMEPGFNLNWMNFIGKEIISINEIESTMAFAFYPNPAHDNIIIVTSEPVWFELYSMMGQLLIREKLASDMNTIPISSLPAGNYIIKIQSDTKSISEIIVIE